MAGEALCDPWPLSMACVKPIRYEGPVSSISFGDKHVALVTYSGSIATGGDNEYGQLGRRRKSARENSKCYPVQGQCKFDSMISVACGSNHCISLGLSGVYVWGRNNAFQLGLPSTDDICETTHLDFSSVLSDSDGPVDWVGATSDVSCLVTRKGVIAIYGGGNATPKRFDALFGPVSNPYLLPRLMRMNDKLRRLCGIFKKKEVAIEAASSSASQSALGDDASSWANPFPVVKTHLDQKRATLLGKLDSLLKYDSQQASPVSALLAEVDAVKRELTRTNCLISALNLVEKSSSSGSGEAGQSPKGSKKIDAIAECISQKRPSSESFDFISRLTELESR